MAAEGKGPTRFALEVLEDATDAAAFRAAIGAGSGSGGTGGTWASTIRTGKVGAAFVQYETGGTKYTAPGSPYLA